MGLSLPLPKPEALAAASARFKAWWNGEPVEEPETEAEGEGGDAATQGAGASDPALASIIAAEALWGSGRTEPGSVVMDVSLAAALGMKKAARLVLLGADAGARAVAISKQCDVRIEAWEAQPLRVKLGAEAAGAAKLSKKINYKVWDGKPGDLPKNRAEALLSLWQCTSEAAVESQVFAVQRILKPSASAMWLDLFATRIDDIDPACAGAEQRGFVEEQSLLDALEPAGIEIASEQDFTPVLLDALQDAWTVLRDDWEGVQARLLAIGGADAAAQALQQVMTWRAREAAMLSGRLTARRYVVGLA
jgi:hypothetical protein